MPSVICWRRFLFVSLAESVLAPGAQDQGDAWCSCLGCPPLTLCNRTGLRRTGQASCGSDRIYSRRARIAAPGRAFSRSCPPSLLVREINLLAVTFCLSGTANGRDADQGSSHGLERGRAIRVPKSYSGSRQQEDPCRHSIAASRFWPPAPCPGRTRPGCPGSGWPRVPPTSWTRQARPGHPSARTTR